MKKKKLDKSQLNLRVRYICKSCKWETSILLAWQDLKPKRCKSCKMSFLADPDKLQVEMPNLSLQEKPRKKRSKQSSKKSKESDEQRQEEERS